MPLVLAWVHDLDQWALRFTDTIGVRWYGLAYVAGFLAGWLILRALAKRRLILLSREEATDLIFLAALGVLAGGRLGYALIYDRPMLWTFSEGFPWWSLLAINKGGMASHGGMAGVILAAWWFSRTRKKPLLHTLDLLALVCPVGLFLGRVANFVNAELLGVVVALPGQPAPWWGVRFPQELALPSYVRSLPDAPLTTVIDTMRPFAPFEEKTTPDLIADVRFGLEEPIESIRLGADTMIGILRDGDPPDSAMVRGVFESILSARVPSQLIQGAAEGIVLGLALWLIWARPRKPGVIGCWVLLLYGVMRVATEAIRLPDEHLAAARLAGLTRGQWLSAAMIVAGVVALAWIVRTSKAQRIGGWRRRRPAPAGG